eukprot:SAG11_NODE_2699_length_3077_cov_2.064473_1_plen_40_part_00
MIDNSARKAPYVGPRYHTSVRVPVLVRRPERRAYIVVRL